MHLRCVYTREAQARRLTWGNPTSVAEGVPPDCCIDSTTRPPEAAVWVPNSYVKALLLAAQPTARTCGHTCGCKS